MPEDFSFKRSPRGSNIEPRRDSRPKAGLVPSGLMCRTGARSRSEVEESRDGPGEFRGGCGTGRVHDYDEIGVCRHDEGIDDGVRNRCAQSGYSGITEIILAKVRRVVAVYIRSALDVALAAKSSINCHSKTCIRATLICEVICLIELRSREATTRARLSTASARLTIASESISLRQIRCGERARRNCLVRASGARWDHNRDSLTPIRKGEVQFKLYLRSACE